jgi:hypothetical protein
MGVLSPFTLSVHIQSMNREQVKRLNWHHFQAYENMTERKNVFLWRTLNYNCWSVLSTRPPRWMPENLRMTYDSSPRKPGWPDEFVKNIQNATQPIFVNINAQTQAWEKSSPKCGLFMEFSKQNVQSILSRYGRKYVQSGHRGDSWHPFHFTAVPPKLQRRRLHFPIT